MAKIDIDDTYPYESAFKRLLPDAEWESGGGANYLTDCPFHEHEESKTLAIDFETGLWHCFNPDCGAKGKGIKQFKQEYLRVLYRDKFFTSWAKGRKLEEDKEVVEYLQTERGLTVEDVAPFKLSYSLEIKKDKLTGVESPKKYILIPVFDNDGDIIAGRKFLLPAYREKDDPKIKFAWRKSPITLYPKMPDKKAIILVEGEWDAIVLQSKGFPAVTTTGGQGGASFLGFIEELKTKTVYICFDCDKAGRTGADQVAKALAPYTKVFIIDLGLEDGEDVTDYFVKYQHSVNDFKNLVRQAQPYQVMGNKIDLSELGAESLNRQVTIQGRVMGDAGLYKYIYPTYGVLKCKGYDLDACAECPLRDEERIVQVSPNSKDVMELIEQTPDKQKQYFAAKAHVPFLKRKRCDLWTFDEKRTKYEMAVPVFIESTDDDTPQSKREWQGYVTTEKAASKIKSGREVLLHILPLQDTKNDGRFTFISEEVIPVQDDLDTFKMTESLHEKLKIFQGDPQKKIPEIAKNLNDHVFRFRGREHLIIAYDLAYHSVIRFQNPNAPNRTIKGWVEALIIGDPGEGKSQLAVDMSKYYGLGAYQDAATATPGGLTVTTVQMGGKWVFRDGLMPLNDRRLVFIDEFNKMAGEDLGRLNTSRSAGKITASSSAGVYEKPARTRLVWITNPKDGRRVDTSDTSVKYPIELVSQLFPDRGAQDRLDYAVLVLRDDPKPELPTIPEDASPYTSELCRQLILWAWTRTPEQIYFTDDAIQAIREQSLYLRNKFWNAYSDIELINSGERTTERLMRLSVAVAARVYSTADGENLFVTPQHVLYAAQFLETQYVKMGLDKYVQNLMVKARYREQPQTEKSATKINVNNNNVDETQVIDTLLSDRILYDSLNEGSYDMQMEKDRHNRNVVRWLYGMRYVHTSDFRFYQFTKLFYQELLPKLKETPSPI